MRPLASSHFGKSVGGISVSPVLVCVCFDLYNDDRRPTDETSLHHWPANRRYDVIHRQDVHPTVEWTLPKTFNPDNCKQHDSFGTPRSDLTGDSLNDQTQWSCSSRCYPIFGHLSCSSLGSILTWPTRCDQWDWDWIAAAAYLDIAGKRYHPIHLQTTSSSECKSTTILFKSTTIIIILMPLVVGTFQTSTSGQCEQKPGHEPGYPRATSTSSWIVNRCLYGLLNSLHFLVEWIQYSTFHQTWDHTVEWRYDSTLLLLHQISRACHARDMWYHDKSTSNSDVHVHMQLQMIRVNI